MGWGVKEYDGTTKNQFQQLAVAEIQDGRQNVRQILILTITPIIFYIEQQFLGLCYGLRGQGIQWHHQMLISSTCGCAEIQDGRQNGRQILILAITPTIFYIGQQFLGLCYGLKGQGIQWHFKNQIQQLVVGKMAANMAGKHKI